MKIPRYVIRTTQLFFFMLCALPLRALAITQVAACFQNTASSITPAIPSDPTLDYLRQPNCIKVDSVEIGAESQVTIGSSSNGIGAGRLEFSSLTIKKRVDDASPILFLSMATGTRFRQIIIYFIEESRSAGVVSVSNLTTWQLGVAFVTKINTINESGLDESDLRGTESVTVVFGEMRFTQGSRSVTWSQITNSANVPNTPPLSR
jgi:type VI secretion system secreted protein Hcp